MLSHNNGASQGGSSPALHTIQLQVHGELPLLHYVRVQSSPLSSSAQPANARSHFLDDNCASGLQLWPACPTGPLPRTIRAFLTFLFALPSPFFIWLSDSSPLPSSYATTACRLSAAAALLSSLPSRSLMALCCLAIPGPMALPRMFFVLPMGLALGSLMGVLTCGRYTVGKSVEEGDSCRGCTRSHRSSAAAVTLTKPDVSKPK